MRGREGTISDKSEPSVAGKILRALGYAAAGFASVAIPLHLLLKSNLRNSSEDVRAQGWPIQLMQVLFAKFILQWVEVEGLANLPQSSYVVACNHGYKSGVDGFILGHLLATLAGRVPRIVITAENRNWVVRAERWVLHHYGIALLVPDEALGPAARHRGMSDVIAAYLRENDHHAVLIFPAGRANADPAVQLRNWSTGAVVAAAKSGCPVVPVAFGGLRLDATPETVIFDAMEADAPSPPFRIRVRIGEPIYATSEPHRDLENVRASIATLMNRIPELKPAAGESDVGFGKISLRDGRVIAFMDRGPRDGTPVVYFHGFQGSRLESYPGMDEVLERLHVRLISPDRPGIGLSTPSRDRTVVSWASDVRQLTEQLLGPEQGFSILGFSAGATYALACGNVPGLKAISLVSGMGLPHEITNWRRYSQEAWRVLLSAKLANFHSGTFLDIEQRRRNQVMDNWDVYFDELRHDLSADDQEILGKAVVEALFQRNRREGYAQSPGCLLQEVQALYSDPQIDLEHLKACSVLITHGGDDNVIPLVVAEDLHKLIPSSRFSALADRGHYFIYGEGQFERLLAELLSAHNECS